MVNTRRTTKQINVNVYLTHNGSSKFSLSEINDNIKQATPANQIDVVLDAFLLCDELKKAINQMFSNPPEEIKTSILDTFEKEPPILCVKK